MKLKSHFFASLLAMSVLGVAINSCSDSDVFYGNIISDTATPCVQTKEVTAAQAQDIARTFSSERFGISPDIASRSSQTIETITADNGSAFAYVINTDGAGWVIVSALRTYFPILAYSDKPGDTFSLSDRVVKESGLSVWMTDILAAIETSETLDSITARSIAYEWLQYSPEIMSTNSVLPGDNDAAAVACRNRLKVLNDTYYKDGWSFRTLSATPSGVVPASVYSLADSYNSPYQYTIVGVRERKEYKNVDKLLTTTWDQDYPYNGKCNGEPHAGCVPVAMAQVMKFHNFPTKYNWSDMPKNYATESIKQLIYDCGISVGIVYGSGDVGATVDETVAGMRSFGYDATSYPHAATRVVDELYNHRRPVIMSGYPASGDGHAWVCEGVESYTASANYYVEFINSVNEYTNRGETLIENPPSMEVSTPFSATFYMNWGWSGIYNNWYKDPTPGGRDYTYNRVDIYVNPK